MANPDIVAIIPNLTETANPFVTITNEMKI